MDVKRCYINADVDPDRSDWPDVDVELGGAVQVGTRNDLPIWDVVGDEDQIDLLALEPCYLGATLAELFDNGIDIYLRLVQRQITLDALFNVTAAEVQQSDVILDDKVSPNEWFGVERMAG